MKEYYIDLLEFNDTMAHWLIDQGAEVEPLTDWRTPTWNNSHIRFGKRQIHRFAGSSQVRIFFDDTNLDVATALLLIHSSIVFKHNIKVEELE